MKKIIRLTESDLHNIVRESVVRILNEDGEGAALGGDFTTPGASSDSTDRVGAFTVPIGGVIRKPSPVGKKSKKKEKNIIKPNDETFSREGGFSVNGKAEWNVNEGKFGNALKVGALSAMMALGANNASAQKHQYTENPYVNGKELVNHPYAQKYGITYDDENTSSLIYDLLRNNAKYRDITPEISAKIRNYPKYDMKKPVEKFLKANKDLINRCGGKVGGVDSSVTFVNDNGAYYLVPSDIRKL